MYCRNSYCVPWHPTDVPKHKSLDSEIDLSELTSSKNLPIRPGCHKDILLCEVIVKIAVAQTAPLNMRSGK